MDAYVGWNQVIVTEAIDCARDFVNNINKAIGAHEPGKQLTKSQACWVGFCITAILMTNVISWAAFKRISLGIHSEAALSWMFCRARFFLETLFQYSVLTIINTYGIKDGVLVLDESDKYRSKNTKKIAYVNKMKDKKSGGYIMGQMIVFLLLVTNKVSVPVGFKFYNSDPKMKAWRKKDKQLKKLKIKKSNRPPAPEKDPQYPTVKGLALQLLSEFTAKFPDLKIKAVLADALYGNASFMDHASKICGDCQVISQIKNNQLVQNSSWKARAASEYFKNAVASKVSLQIRGVQSEGITVVGARLMVKAHGKKRFVIAMKYDGESEYRYLVATDLTWRMTDIIEAYTLRWLIEVFFEDWKGYTGWSAMAKQPGVDGSRSGLILSLLVDHCLLLHTRQQALIENNMPAATVGSLRESIRFDALVNFMRQILSAKDPQQHLDLMVEQIEQIIVLRQSSKHMVGRSLGNLCPSPSLLYKAA